MVLPKSIRLDASLRQEYEALFRTCQIQPHRRALVTAAARKVLAARARYEAVGAVSRVPWFVVGGIHLLESGCDFQRHLHNGDPLSQRTLHVPRGRPAASPPFQWETSALDALQMKQLGDWTDWSVAGTLFKLEGYNGFGYRRLADPIPTPYLWSFTNHYKKGKFAADRRFDRDLVSAQVGVVALFREIEKLAELTLWPAPDAHELAIAPLEEGAMESAVAAGLPYPGRVIRRGETNGAIVAALQAQLVAQNCGPIDEEGEFGGETEAAVKLFQSRNVDGSGAPLAVDGRVGPVTWEALFGRASVPVVETSEQTDPLLRDTIAVAITQVGVSEEPPFQNNGKRVEEYLASIGLQRGSDWCAAFLYWCFEQAARKLEIPNPLPRTGGCLKHWADAGKLGVRRIVAARAVEDPGLLMPGHVFIMDHGGGRGHTGIVVSVRGGVLETIEGNTNAGMGRAGTGVFRRTQRTVRSINVGFIDYAGSIPVEPGGTGTGEDGDAAGPATPTPAVPATPVVALRDMAPLVESAPSRGLLLKAVMARSFEPPLWLPVPYKGLTLQVGAHTLRAQVGGRLFRLPVSYTDVLAICREMEWIPPTIPIVDAIWDAATVRFKPQTLGLWNTAAQRKDSSLRMVTLEWVVDVNDMIDAAIPRERWGELCASEGKDWVLSPRNLLTVAGHRAATTYGWKTLPKGKPIQGKGLDHVPPAHNEQHWDYSQTLRPIQRFARAADDSKVDLLDVIADEGMPAAVLAPLRMKNQAPLLDLALESTAPAPSSRRFARKSSSKREPAV